MNVKKSFISLLLAIVLLSLIPLSVFAASTGTITTKADPLRVRSGPGTTFACVKQNGADVKLPKGSYVTILDEVNCSDGSTTYTWYHIEATYNGSLVSGYVASTYVTVTSTPDEPEEEPDVEPGNDIYSVPELYRPYLKPLMDAHPNWTFTFYETGLDWNTVMNNECYAGAAYRNVLSPSATAAYRYVDASGNYKLSEEGWYQASDATVAYYMDPRNLMTESRMFQFQLLSYDESLQTLAGIEAILVGSFMANTKITATDGRLVTYAQAIMEAAQQHGASPYYLATKIIQEIGRNGSGSSSGSYIAKDGTSYAGYYNFYNIQATSSTSDPIAQGLAWASSGDTYGRPWNSPYKSIVGGAQYITKGYISVGQDSIYLQKFDVDNSDGKLYWHQYMTNVAGACNEASILYRGYTNNNMLTQSFVFAIPLYKNMPAQRCRLAGDTSVDPDPIPDPVPEPEPTPSGITGDANNDGDLTVIDARYILQAVAGLRTLDDIQRAQADMTGDGLVRANDARYVLQSIAGIR